MISLEQIHKLDLQVNEAIQLINTLRDANTALSTRVAEMEAQIAEQKKREENRRIDDQQLEKGLQGVFEILDQVDPKAVTPIPSSPPSSVEPPPGGTAQAPAKEPSLNSESGKDPLPAKEENSKEKPEKKEPLEKETDLSSQKDTGAETRFPKAESPSSKEEKKADSPSLSLKNRQKAPAPDKKEEPSPMEKEDEEIVLNKDAEILPEDDDKFQSEFDIF